MFGALQPGVRSRLRGGFLALLVLLTACQSPAVPGVRSSPSPAGPLAQADAMFFSGDYDGAEARYLEQMKAGVTDAQAHYALLLTYEDRFREAVTQAASAVSADPDSASLARLTRALDWSQDLPAAVAAGARAIATQPVDPLAHVFYSEALADSGHYDEAKQQLKAAEQAGGDAYVTSEIDREWANYYRDRSVNSEELNHIELSLKEQRGFPERWLERVRYSYSPDHPDVARARSLLGRIRSSFGNRSAVLVSAAETALLAGDFDTARSFYRSALSRQPGGSEASLGLALLDCAVQHDFQAAHSRLLAVLKAHPGDADAYLFLLYLDRLVLKQDPLADLGPAPAAAAAQLDAGRADALQRVNAYRSLAGVKPAAANSALAEAAEAHSYYFLFNYGAQSEVGLGVHQEDPSLPGFTGANSLLRDRHFGYQGTRGAEVINHVFSARASVQVWVDSVYHRLPILDAETQAIGYGEATVGPLSIQTMDIGLGGPGAGGPVVYPYPDQPDAPTAFLGNEVPSPVPPTVNYPVGYPVTLQVGGAQRLSITSAHLFGPDGSDVPAYVLLPATGALAPSAWALLAKLPLATGATYTVQVAGTLDGSPFAKRWSFTAGSF